MAPRSRNLLVLLVKLVLIGGFLYLALRHFHWNDYVEVIDGQPQTCRGFHSTIISADGYVLAASFGCFMVPTFIMAFRWWYLLRVQDIRISYVEAVRLTYLGLFFSYVVPGTVSGDLVKAYYVCKHTDRKAAALLSIFVDRAVGLLEFALLPSVVMAGMVLAGVRTERFALAKWIVPAAFAVVASSLAVVLSPRLRRLLRLKRILSRLPIQRHLTVAARAADVYRRRWGALLKALALTFCGQGAFITAVLVAGSTLAPHVPWYQYYLYIPLFFIIAAVPISPGGLGVMEALYVAFFVSAKTTAPEALALALTARLFPLVCSTPGIVFALTGPKLPDRAELAAELEAPPQG